MMMHFYKKLKKLTQISFCFSENALDFTKKQGGFSVTNFIRIEIETREFIISNILQICTISNFRYP